MCRPDKGFHNIIDTEKIKTKASLPGGFSDDFDGIRLLTVGRLTEQKSYPTAIRAMKKSRRNIKMSAGMFSEKDRNERDSNI